MSQFDDPTWPSLTTRELAARLGCRPQTLEKWRISGEGPPYCVVGRTSIRYSPEAVQAWLASRVKRSTSDCGPSAAPSQPQKTARR